MHLAEQAFDAWRSLSGLTPLSTAIFLAYVYIVLSHVRN